MELVTLGTLPTKQNNGQQDKSYQEKYRSENPLVLIDGRFDRISIHLVIDNICPQRKKQKLSSYERRKTLYKFPQIFVRLWNFA